MTEWYYAIDGEQFGPVSDREIHDRAGDGSLQPSDLVWKDGFADWQQASAVAGLFPGVSSVPPAPQNPPPKPRIDHFAETQVGPDTPPPRSIYGTAALPSEIRTPDSLKIPVLVSLIWNVGVAAVCALTCVGLIVSIPLGFLAWNEWQLWQKVDKVSTQQFAADAKALAIWQIVAGLVSIVSLVCGIILMIEGGKHENRQQQPA